MQGIGGGGGGTKRRRREQKAEAQNGSTMGGQKADNSTKREATLGRVRPPSAHPLLEQHSEPLEETPTSLTRISHMTTFAFFRNPL